MTESFPIHDFSLLEPGELYFFASPLSPECGVWGLFERMDRRQGVLLAACSGDLQHFNLWTPLPSGYTCCRLASRAELRDFLLRLNLRFTDDEAAAAGRLHS